MASKPYTKAQLQDLLETIRKTWDFPTIEKLLDEQLKIQWAFDDNRNTNKYYNNLYLTKQDHVEEYKKNS